MFLKDDYQGLITKKGTTARENKRLRLLTIELFKTKSNIKPSYMKNIFTSKTCKTKSVVVQTLESSLEIAIFNKSQNRTPTTF